MNYNLFPKKLRESEIQKQIMEVLKLSGWLVVRVNSGTTISGNRYIRNYIIYNNSESKGFPDLMAFKGKEYLLIEVKRSGGKLRPAQKNFIELAENYGAKVKVIDNIDDLERLLNNG